MVIARKDDKRWMVASYGEDGSLLGWATSRDTCMCWTINCAVVDKSAAERLCVRMERIWPGRIWLVEPAPRTHIDSRTGASLPADVVGRRGMDAAVAEGFVREQERDGAFGRAHRKPLHNKPTQVLDTARPHALASVLRRQVDSAGGAGIEQADVEDGAGNDDEEGDDMVLVKTKGSRAAKKGKTSAKAKATTPKVTTKVPKMQLRTATVTSKRKAAETNGGGPCLCGCGAQAKKWLLRGHVKKVNSSLAAIKAGTTTPEKEFGKAIAAAYGPWKKLAAGGQKPATVDFDKVRAAV